ncbi:hypothetical protein GCM10010964_33490 [Caldovatus sediminis]|uniref:Uncharacterized protein n=1 Tax=Caldovatus sediminis TaxID=2041189 RepID=A0A8J2ZDZ9_9PROT|nr:hypothetical protein GCM10010964_33490 [Caldovatus sediminis]
MPILAAVALAACGLVATVPVAPAEAQGWSGAGGGGGARVAPPPRGPGGGLRPPPAPGPAPLPAWRAPPPGHRPAPGVPWSYRPYAWSRPGPAWRPPPYPYHGWYRPWGAWGWYRPWGWWGYGVFVPSVTFGFGLGVVPDHYGYPYALPYPPPPAYYPPVPGRTCVAGAVTCPLREPAEPGDACYCPTPDGPAWGRVDG